MASPSRIAELAALVQAKTAVVDEYITSNGLPSPSFDASTPPMLPLPESITQARDEALEAIDELQSLLLGPMGSIFHDLTVMNTKFVSLHALTRYNMPSLFPATATTTVPDLATASGLSEDDTRRLIRHAAAHHLFAIPNPTTSPDTIAHTASSLAIANVPLFRQWIDEGCTNMWPPASRIVDAMAKWPGSQEPNETAFNLSHGTERTFFEELAVMKDRDGGRAAARFADSMSFFQANPTMATGLLVDNYDWVRGDGGSAPVDGNGVTVVDIGGSHGAVAVELAKKHPGIRCIVQDLPEVIASVPSSITTTKLSPSDNGTSNSSAATKPGVYLQPHDFFTPQPILHADTYLLRMILHNWSDAYAHRILQSLIPALKPGARIVINDHVVPGPGVLSAYQERPVRGFDLVMKQLFNAKERDEGDWRRLLEGADPDSEGRFELVGVVRPRGSRLQIVDVKWRG